MATAVLDVMNDDGGGFALYRVTVTGAGAAAGKTKVYEVRDTTQDNAAMGAIATFTEEVENGTL